MIRRCGVGLLTQQVRDEDMARVRRAFSDRPKINAELRRFSTICRGAGQPTRRYVISPGRGTVSELAAIGRPSILVPLPGAIDQDQFANAGVLSEAGGALRIAQSDFTPEWLASKISDLAADPAKLVAMAKAAGNAGRLDAAERLADLVA